MQGMSRGEMNLVSADPHDRPHLLYHYLEDSFDVDRLRSGTRKMAEIVDSEAFRRIGAKRVSPTKEGFPYQRGFPLPMRSWLRTELWTGTSATT